VQGCLAQLDDPDPSIVARSVEALGKLAAPGVPIALVAQLEHENPNVRAAAATALFRCRFAPLWRGEVTQPPPLPSEALAALIDALRDPESAVRGAVVYAFSRYGQPEAAPHLERFVADEDEWTRLFAVRGIGQSGAAGRVHADVVVAALDDPSHHVRTESVNALAALGLAGRIPAAVAADPSFHVRASVARALAVDESVDSLRLLQALEQDPSSTVRTAALDALVRRSGDGMRGEIERWMSEDDWRVRAAAARAAGHLGRAGLPLIERARRDSDHRVWAAALGGLGKKLEDADRLVLEALRDDDLAVRGTAVALAAERDLPGELERLEEAYEESAGVAWIEVREAIVNASATLDGAEPLLRRVARSDSAASVRANARAALARRGILLRAEPAASHDPSPLLGRRFETDPIVTLETSKGKIRIRCHARQAPIHVASFVDLVRDGFYDGLIWHRVVSNFVIQGGDPRGDGWGGAGATLRDEIHTGRYGPGAVGMPKAGKDTGSGQIFITHLPTPHLDGNYTLFGRVTAGLEVVDRIEVGDRIVRARVERAE
jgi:cyclophilin family peptidyl-prolyl cis-trans isomerase/HEAT repeat protein